LYITTVRKPKKHTRIVVILELWLK